MNSDLPPPYPLSRKLARDGMYMHREHDLPPTAFQVLGERGSGTNFVRKLIELNLTIFRSEALGWKHATPHSMAIPTEFLPICVFRDARDWAISMHKRPWASDDALRVLEFPDFLRAPWEGRVDRPDDFGLRHPELETQDCVLQFDRHPVTGRPYENLFALRAGKMEALFGMINRDCNVCYVRFETVKADPLAFLDALVQTFDLERSTKGAPKLPTRRMGNNFNRSVGVIPPTPKRFPQTDMPFLRSAVNLDLEALLGYDYGVG